MATNGTSFEIDIPVAADGVDSAAARLAHLADTLAGAEAAASQAAAAVRAGADAYRQAEVTADKAAKAVERIGLAADVQREKLKAAAEANDDTAAARAANTLQKLSQRQAEAAEKAKVAAAALASEATALDALKVASEGAANKQKLVAEQFEKAGEAAEGAKKASAAAAGTGNLGKLKGALGDLGGPLGSGAQKAVGFVDAWGDLKEVLGAAGPYAAVAVAIVAIVASVVALTAAAVIGTAKIAQWAVGLADSARSQRLLTAGIAGSVEGGEELAGAIRSLEKRVPLAREEIEGLAAELVKGGKKGAELTTALEEAAEKAARVKFGPEFAKELLSLNNQSKRLQGNFGKLFGGLKIDALLEGFSKLVDLFDETSVTGNAIKVVFESLFQPLVDGVTGFVPMMVRAFINFEILVLKALIAIKPFGSSILLLAKAFGIMAAVIGGVLVVAMTLFLAPFVLAFGLLTAAIAVAMRFGRAIFEVGAAIAQGPTAAIAYFGGKLNELVTWLTGMSLSELGAQLMQGLVDGIRNGGQAVVDSVKGTVGNAITAAKQALGIASPSRVFAEIGMQTAAGMAGGVEGGAAPVTSALESMVAPPEAAAAGAGTGAGGNTIQITINAGDGAQAKDIASAVEEVLTRILEGDVAKLGGAVPNG